MSDAADSAGMPEPRLKKPWPGRLSACAIVALWIASLLFPAAWSHDDTGQWNHYDGPIYGWEILMFGWAAMFEGQFGWFANPLLIPALLLPGPAPSERRRGASIGVLFALALCLAGGLTFRINNISFGPEWNTPYGAGRILWLVAIGGAVARLGLLLFLGSRTGASPLPEAARSAQKHGGSNEPGRES